MFTLSILIYFTIERNIKYLFSTLSILFVKNCISKISLHTATTSVQNMGQNGRHIRPRLLSFCDIFPFFIFSRSFLFARSSSWVASPVSVGSHTAAHTLTMKRLIYRPSSFWPDSSPAIGYPFLNCPLCPRTKLSQHHSVDLYTRLHTALKQKRRVTSAQ